MSDEHQTQEINAFWKDGELFLKTDKEIRESINGLEFSARKLLMHMKELRIEDIFFMSVIDKSLKLLDPFLSAYKNKNIYVLTVLTRVQIDCAIRTYAMTLVEDSTEYCNSVLIRHEEVHKMKDKNNQKLNDRYMCEKLGEYLGVPVYQLYQKTSEFIHFSSVSLNLMAKPEEENSFTLLIGKKTEPILAENTSDSLRNLQTSFSILVIYYNKSYCSLGLIKLKEKVYWNKAILCCQILMSKLSESPQTQ